VQKHKDKELLEEIELLSFRKRSLEIKNGSLSTKDKKIKGFKLKLEEKIKRIELPQI